MVVEAEPTPIAQEPEVKKAGNQGDKPAERREGEGKGRRDNRDRPYKPKGDRAPRGPRREGDGKPRQYKPKYEAKEGEAPQKRSSSSGSSSSEEVQQFKKAEIEKL